MEAVEYKAYLYCVVKSDRVAFKPPQVDESGADGMLYPHAEVEFRPILLPSSTMDIAKPL